MNRKGIHRLALKSKVLLGRRDARGERRVIMQRRTQMLDQAWSVQKKESFFLHVARGLRVRWER